MDRPCFWIGFRVRLPFRMDFSAAMAKPIEVIFAIHFARGLQGTHNCVPMGIFCEGTV